MSFLSVDKVLIMGRSGIGPPASTGLSEGLFPSDQLTSVTSNWQVYGTTVVSTPSPKNQRTLSESALGGTRTPNLLIRSQMLYPLSYKRWET